MDKPNPTRNYPRQFKNPELDPKTHQASTAPLPLSNAPVVATTTATTNNTITTSRAVTGVPESTSVTSDDHRNAPQHKLTVNATTQSTQESELVTVERSHPYAPSNEIRETVVEGDRDASVRRRPSTDSSLSEPPPYTSSDERETAGKTGPALRHKASPRRLAQRRRRPRPNVTTVVEPSIIQLRPAQRHDQSTAWSPVDDDTVTGNWSLDDDFDHLQNSQRRADQRGSMDNPRSRLPSIVLSAQDLALCQRLDQDYERALESLQVGYSARYYSVRQSALCSVIFMLVLLTLGTIFFLRQAPFWSLEEALLFSVYTITTVGYGHLQHPETAAFQLYTVAYIFVGIATLTIMVAQVYQCVALEAARAQHAAADEGNRRNAQMPDRDGIVRDQRHNQDPPSLHHHETRSQSFSSDMVWEYSTSVWDSVTAMLRRAYRYFRQDEFGRSLSVIFPMTGLVLIGAVVIGVLESWTWPEALYFAVVSLTTVGFGDYYPTNPAAIWFCTLWLPFSVGFMSVFLAKVAAFYIRLSDTNISRIERALRQDLVQTKRQAARERQAALARAMRGQQLRDIENDHGHKGESHDLALKESIALAKETVSQHRRRRRGFDTVPTQSVEAGKAVVYKDNDGEDCEDSTADNSAGLSVDSESRRHLFGSPEAQEDPAETRRELVLRNSLAYSTHSDGDELVDEDQELEDGRSETSDGTVSRPRGSTLSTMKDVLRTVHGSDRDVRYGPDSEFLSVTSKQPLHAQHHALRRRSQSLLKPSFALRALVQERFAEIIATDIAGYQNAIEIKDNSMTVTILRLKAVADKWCVPRRARKAFRAVAFETLYFVGEHDLIVEGADALFALSPLEFHSLFAPLVAALGDATTMETWLEQTQVLADVDLISRDERVPQSMQEQRSRRRPRRLGRNDWGDVEEDGIIKGEERLYRTTDKSTRGNAAIPGSELHLT
uniref:Potassium channel domain-containing protein n=1 Tax=Phaeodactylum tricornutum TaxID=2850 RepID=A0A8J9S115_PHATR